MFITLCVCAKARFFRPYAWSVRKIFCYRYPALPPWKAHTPAKQFNFYQFRCKRIVKGSKREKKKKKKKRAHAHIHCLLFYAFHVSSIQLSHSLYNTIDSSSRIYCVLYMLCKFWNLIRQSTKTWGIYLCLFWMLCGINVNRIERNNLWYLTNKQQNFTITKKQTSKWAYIWVLFRNLRMVLRYKIPLENQVFKREWNVAHILTQNFCNLYWKDDARPNMNELASKVS